MKKTKYWNNLHIDTHFFALCCVLLTVLLYINFASAVHPISLGATLNSFPRTIGSFTMKNSQSFSQEIIDNAGMDDYLMWQYQDEDGYTIGLYIGYYRQQTEGSIIHSPKHCLPGSGWQIFNKSKLTYDFVGGSSGSSINRMLLQKGVDKQLAHYWYHSRGRVIAGEYFDRALMIFDSVLRRRSDGSLVRITGPGADLELDIRKQSEFIAALMPVLDDFLPR